MAKAVYDTITITLVDETPVTISPLKIKFLREFMDTFGQAKNSTSKVDAINALAKCVAISMQQYYPQIKTVDDVEDNIDLKTMYKILDVAAGIKINQNGTTETVQEDVASAGTAWEDFDLAKLESELFLIGIWKDYEDLESSLSIPELMITLNAKREIDYNEKKFLASMQGVNLDEAVGKQEEDPWQRLQARAAARARGEDPDSATPIDPNDITSFVGTKAHRAGFGIGMGMEYEKI